MTARHNDMKERGALDTVDIDEVVTALTPFVASVVLVRGPCDRPGILEEVGTTLYG